MAVFFTGENVLYMPVRKMHLRYLPLNPPLICYVAGNRFSDGGAHDLAAFLKVSAIHLISPDVNVQPTEIRPT